MYYVIGKNEADGHLFTTRCDNIDEATFTRDRLVEIGVTSVVITKPVIEKVEEDFFYASKEA